MIPGLEVVTGCREYLGAESGWCDAERPPAGPKHRADTAAPKPLTERLGEGAV